MAPDHDALSRVGVRLIIAAAIAGLIALLFARDAQSDPATVLELTTPEVRSEQQRREAAEQLLREQERRARTELGGRLFDLGLRAVTHSSPTRIAKGAWKIVRDSLDSSDRQVAESQALRLLESDVRGGQAAAATLDLYERLHERERAARADALAEELEDALDGAHVLRATRAWRRLVEIDPEHPDTDAFRRRLAEVTTAPSIEATPIGAVAPWEAGLAMALLVDHPAVHSPRGATREDADLARAASLHATGRLGQARALLEGLAEASGETGSLARDWLADPQLYPEVAIEDLWEEAQTERYLTLMGGERLGRDGLELDRAGYRAWKRSLSVENLLWGLPTRLLEDGQMAVPAPEFREAAQQYIEGHPDDPLSRDLRLRLQELGPASVAKTNAFEDGRLVLPPARTRYSRPPAERLMISPESWDPTLFPDLAREQAWILTGIPGQGAALPAAMATRVLGWLADGLEEGALRPDEGAVGAALLVVQSLDARLSRGEPLWLYPQRNAAELDDDELELADQAMLLAQGRVIDAGAGVAVRRREDELRLQRDWTGGSTWCPDDWLCIERRPKLDGGLFARVDASGRLRLGAHTRLADAEFSLELTRSGPRGSLRLPLGRWLGVPLGLNLRADDDSVSARPRVDKQRGGSAGLR